MTKRAYSSPLRAAAGAATRQRILDAAQHCFETHGYKATTMRAIAEVAGTSLEAVNQVGAKPSLLMTVFRRATAQTDTEDRMLDLPMPKAVFMQEDPVVALSDLMIWIAGVNHRISLLWRCFDQAADADTDVRVEYQGFLSRMRAECSRTVENLAVRNALRVDLPHSELADLLWLNVLPDQHHRLCNQARWSQERYEAWLIASVQTCLLGPSVAPGTGR